MSKFHSRDYRHSLQNAEDIDIELRSMTTKAIKQQRQQQQEQQQQNQFRNPYLTIRYLHVFQINVLLFFFTRFQLLCECGRVFQKLLPFNILTKNQKRRQ